MEWVSDYVWSSDGGDTMDLQWLIQQYIIYMLKILSMCVIMHKNSFNKI